MRRLLIFIAVTCVLGLPGFAAYSWKLQKGKYKEGMIKVFAERAKAREKCVFKQATPHLLGPMTYQTKIYYNRYIALLHQIDTSDCPNDFRDNWLKFIQALDSHYHPSKEESRRQAVLVGADKSSFGFSAGATTGMHVASENKTKQELADDLAAGDPQRAFHELERVALSNGVQSR